MREDDFRRVALSMPDAIEAAHMGHPDFRVNGRIFASLHAGGESGMVKLTPEEQAVVVRESPSMFQPSSGAWGRQGCTNVLLATATQRAVKGAMLLAWERMAAAPARPTASRARNVRRETKAPRPAKAGAARPPARTVRKTAKKV